MPHRRRSFRYRREERALQKCGENPDNMKEYSNNDMIYLRSKKLQLPGIRHLFTTRAGGVSTGVHSTLNLGFSLGDEWDNVLMNYRRVFDVLGCSGDDLFPNGPGRVLRRLSGHPDGGCTHAFDRGGPRRMARDGPLDRRQDGPEDAGVLRYPPGRYPRGVRAMYPSVLL